MAHTTVADPPQSVEPTNSLEETNTPDEHVASEENALAVAEGAPKKKKIIRKKRRPARIQVDPATVKSEPPPQTGTVFNIWYNVRFMFRPLYTIALCALCISQWFEQQMLTVTLEMVRRRQRRQLPIKTTRPITMQYL